MKSKYKYSVRSFVCWVWCLIPHILHMCVLSGCICVNSMHLSVRGIWKLCVYVHTHPNESPKINYELNKSFAIAFTIIVLQMLERKPYEKKIIRSQSYGKTKSTTPTIDSHCEDVLAVSFHLTSINFPPQTEWNTHVKMVLLVHRLLAIGFQFVLLFFLSSNKCIGHENENEGYRKFNSSSKLTVIHTSSMYLACACIWYIFLFTFTHRMCVYIKVIN